MKKNRILAFILALGMAAVFLAGCSTQTDSGTDSSGGTGQKVIGLSLNALDEYQTEWLSYFEAAAKEAGHKVVVTNAEGKVDKQLADVESLVSQKVDIVVIRATDTEGAVPAFEACAAAGIPTIDSGFGTPFVDTLKILSSQKYLTSLQAQYCIEYLEKNADATLKCGYLWGAQGVSTTKERYDGWKDTLLEAFPDRAEIIAEKVANWSAVDSMAIVEDWLQAYPEMNCIVAMSDEMAIAASNVLQAANITLEECMVIGIDGSPNAQQGLRDGTLSATVYTSKKADTKLHMEYITKILAGENFAGQLVDPGDKISALMTKENVDEVLANLG